MNGGTLTLEGVTDSQVSIILAVKERNEGVLIFEPNQMQPVNNPNQPWHPGMPWGPGVPGFIPGVPPPPGNPLSQVHGQEETYNNVMLNFRDDAGLQAVFEVLRGLTGGEPPTALTPH